MLCEGDTMHRFVSRKRQDHGALNGTTSMWSRSACGRPTIRSEAVQRDPHLEALVVREQPTVCKKPNEDVLGDGASAIGVKGSEDPASYF